ncbi:hypothetical protein [Eikenella corrodens]|uniref:Uncharacterized protein n=1 Tax=Eikenella corrodens TaxID=539 RepID=A0A3S9SKH7_EIKCO|nr:hypothetical protein [Eikenella corrodens]AZR59989.1 hypothetical protein ELB75_08105 [Eikenella corrodens]
MPPKTKKPLIGDALAVLGWCGHNAVKLKEFARHYNGLTKISTALARLAVTCILSATRRLVLIFVNPL